MEVAVAHEAPHSSSGRNFDLHKMTFGLSCAADFVLGSVTMPFISLLAHSWWGSFCAIRESYRKEDGLAEFKFDIKQRDLYGAQEQYLRHTTLGAVPSSPRLDQQLISIWTHEASRALRMAEMRGRISADEVGDYFPRCVFRGDQWEDAKLVLEELRSLRHAILGESSRQELLEDLQSTDSGTETLAFLRSIPREEVDAYYESL